ncbi:hypothetical protein GPDM_03170 [Planococcus donghaensis MPA1U2]|uniref:Uncharacterized protein n=1 Tax=Planococcus donghaensis MPA1U2 TaxID=933115 RepID=E7RDV4_9BACL|nr:hypothetical protein GPDM_03170 [Planococcus donghaensis MPA1U2]
MLTLLLTLLFKDHRVWIVKQCRTLRNTGGEMHRFKGKTSNLVLKSMQAYGLITFLKFVNTFSPGLFGLSR